MPLVLPSDQSAPMSAIRLVDYLVLGVLLLIALRMVGAAWNILRIYLGISKRRLEDSTSFAPPAPPPVMALIQRLEALGFTRIGVRSAVLPGNKRVFEWNLVDVPTTTYVSIVPARTMPGGALVGLSSAYGDGAFVVTTFPTTTTVKRPDLDTTSCATSIEDALVLHRQRAAAFADNHGPALPNRSMADLLVRDDTYRSRHGGATLRFRVYRFMAVTAIVILVTGAQLMRVVAFDR